MKTLKLKYLLSVWAVLALLLPAASLHSQETMEDWQRKAVTEFPDLGQAGSTMNLKFLQMVNYLKVTNPSYFKDPKWPYTLAQQIAKPNAIPGLDAPQPVGGLTTVTGTNSDGSVDASSLAKDFQSNPKAADAYYTGKRFIVKGKISRIAPSDNPAFVAYVYLETGNGLPAIKAELNKMKKYSGNTDQHYEYSDKHGFELRVSDDSVLEVRSHDVHTQNLPFVNNNYTHVKTDQWNPVISKGEVIKVNGNYDGRMADIVLSSADLMKDDTPY